VVGPIDARNFDSASVLSDNPFQPDRTPDVLFATVPLVHTVLRTIDLMRWNIA
jgi:hypothetical protein